MPALPPGTWWLAPAAARLRHTGHPSWTPPTWTLGTEVRPWYRNLPSGEVHEVSLEGSTRAAHEDRALAEGPGAPPQHGRFSGGSGGTLPCCFSYVLFCFVSIAIKRD